MKAGHGFLMIELLVYLAISTMLCLLMLQWATVNHMGVLKQAKLSMACLELHAARDLLAQDLRAATGEIFKRHEGCYVWNTHAGSVGWEGKQGVLLRSQGTYNYRAHSWVKRTQSIIMSNITHWRIERAATPGAQQAELGHGSERLITMHVFARNREVV